MTTWMLLEDEPDLYEVLLSMYSLFGVEGIAFTIGEEAIKWVEAVDHGELKPEIPELALLDIRLPGEVNGVMVSERIRYSPVLGDMCIVLITAYRLSASEEAEVMEISGADALLYKPLPPMNDLKKRLDALMR
jgi:CheY-like chemotaxis protein